MKQFMWIVLLATTVPALAAQDRPDTSDAAEARALRQRIRQRWHERVRQDLNLSNDQAAKLEDTEGRFMQRRREIGERQRAINRELREQLQPGVAANADSVRKLMEERERNRRALVELEQDENKEIAGYLSPVQQARYQLMREHLRRRIDQIRDRRQAGGEMTGPPGRMRPRPQGERPRRKP
jgi:Spy/CpxP family protein refolding chaperone